MLKSPAWITALLSRERYQLPPEACHLFYAREPALQGEAGSHQPSSVSARMARLVKGQWGQLQGLAASLEHRECGCITSPALSSRNAKQMPAAVAEALQSVLQLEGGLSPSEAEKYLTVLEQTQRFQSETWS